MGNGVAGVCVSGCPVLRVVTLRSIPALGASSQEGVKFWRFRKQAQQDLQMVRGLCVAHSCGCPVTSPSSSSAPLRVSSVTVVTIWTRL